MIIEGITKRLVELDLLQHYSNRSMIVTVGSYTIFMKS